MRIGITGHQKLEEPNRWGWVQREIDNILAGTQTPLIGVTSLAIGADQLFAEAVLRHYGTLEVVIPYEGYEQAFTEGHDRGEYFRLLKEAARVEVLQRTGTNEEAYYEAGKRVADSSDFIVAVWNGKPAVGLGGTADIVQYARQIGKMVVHLNPIQMSVNDL
jgi:hypothetical protein